MSFKPSEFLSEPDLDEFDNLTKEDLISLGKHLDLNVKRAMRKQEIQTTLVKHLTVKGLFKESALSMYKDSTDAEVKKMELTMNLELRKIDLEKEKWAYEERERKQEKEFALEKQRMENELELRKLEIESIRLRSKSDLEKFDITKQIRLLPQFQETDVDGFFLLFEKIAKNLKWPEEFWTMLLQSVLLGRAREIYTQLSVEQAADYERVKKFILNGYELVPEAYRQRFRECRRESSQTFVEFARTKEQLFERWCSSRKIEKSFEELRQLVMIEEFKRCIDNNIRIFIDEQNVTCLEAAGRLADDYVLTHKQTYVEHDEPTPQRKHERKPFGIVSQYMSNNSDNNSHQDLTLKPTSFVPTEAKPFSKPFGSPICNYCKKGGHVLSECYKLKRKQSGDFGRPTYFLTISDKVVDPNIATSGKRLSSSTDSIMEVFRPFLFDGFVSLFEGSEAVPITILRDTGASQSIMVTNVLPLSQRTFTGSSVLIKGVDSLTYTPIPLHHIYLTSDLVSGPVLVGVKSLPFDGIQLLLGNDLAGDKVKADPLVSEVPCYNQKPGSIELEIPELYPSCVITRSMSTRRVNDTPQETTHVLNSTSLVGDTSGCNDLIQPNKTDDCLLQLRHQPNDSEIQPLSVLQDDIHGLVARQHKDPEVAPLFEEVVNEREVENNQVCYYTKNVSLCVNGDHWLLL